MSGTRSGSQIKRRRAPAVIQRKAVMGGEVRYWRGAYDEDRARDREIRLARGIACDDREREITVFHALVGVQILMVVLAITLSLAELFSNSR